MTDENALTHDNGIRAALTAGEELGREKNRALHRQWLRDRFVLADLPAHLLMDEDGHIINLEKAFAAPKRIRGGPAFVEEAGFVDYVRAHKLADVPLTAESNASAESDSRIYADPGTFKFTAVIDHPGREAPRWAQHRAAFDPPLHDDWRAWSSVHDTKIAQVPFAEFIGDMLPTIAEPEAGLVLDMVRSLIGTKNRKIVASDRPEDGITTLHLDEETKVHAGDARDIAILDELTIRCPVFFRTDASTFKVRVRTGVTDEGKLYLRALIVRRQETVDDAFKCLCDGIDTASGVRVWLGAPPKLDDGIPF